MTDYGSDYFEARIDERRAEMQRQEYARIHDLPGVSGGTVLDVGCGLGEFLDLFDAAGWNRYGIEVSQYARTAAAARGVAFDLPDGDGWCDLVIMRGSLQHLERPLDMLWNAHRWLRKGGWLCILATPNAGGPFYRLFQDLPALDPPRNYMVFSDRVLRQCLANIGFRSVAFRYPYLRTPYASPLSDHLRFVARLAGVRTPFAFWRNMMEAYAQR